MTSDDDAKAGANRIMRAYSDEARQIVNELIGAAHTRDAVAGGELAAKCLKNPALACVVLGYMAAAAATALPTASPNPDAKPSPWEVAVGDQIRSAANDGDFDSVAAIAVDANIKSLVEDFRNHKEQSGQWPQLKQIVASMELLDRMMLLLIGAEALRRLTLRELGES